MARSVRSGSDKLLLLSWLPGGRFESQVDLDNSSRVTATTLQELGNLGRDLHRVGRVSWF